MNNLYSRYVGFVYLKSFFIVFVALEFFYVGIDFLINLKDIPASANLQLLYLAFTSLTAFSYILPISLVLALIISNINMVRSNELISFYSLGISKNAIIMPQFLLAMIITCFYVALNCTPFAYSYDYQKSITKDIDFQKNTENSFLRFNGKFIYIKKLDSNKKTMQDITIFDINKTDLNSVINAKSAKFLDNIWIFDDVKTTKLPNNIDVGLDGLKVSNDKSIKSLKGFSPKSIQNADASKKSGLSIVDTIDFIFTFKNESSLINSAKSTFYKLAVAPFFAPFLLLILYYYLPVVGRFFNLALANFIFIIISLSIWGVLFVLIKFSNSGVIVPEIGILLPVFILLFYSIYLVKVNSKD